MSQPSKAEFVLAATNNACAAFSRTASRRGPRSSPERIALIVIAFSSASPPFRSSSVAF